ncbi:MAG: LysR family transcriptional regulator [Labilithrix sp.]|nr:LysR family transcriptional regulator [Labilithrix sp.]
MSAAHSISAVDLNLLVVLDELLRVRSTTKAARRLGRTQSAISHALARLRATFRDPLFVRVGAALCPTTVAEGLEPALRKLLADAEAIVLRSASAEGVAKLERTFVIGGTDYAEIVVLPRLLPRLRREAPGVSLVTRFLGDDVDRALQAREVDLAYGASLRALSGITVEKVADVPMAVLLRRGHPALRGRLTPRSYAALEHVLVTPRGLPGSTVDSALEPHGLTRRVVLRIPHFAAAAAIVAETDLVVTLPGDFAASFSRRLGLVTRPVPFAMRPTTFYIGYSSTYAGDAAHRWLRQSVVEAARARASARSL